MGVHTGTHVDAPFHFIDDGKTVENLDIDMLTGRAYVLHLPDEVDLITKEIIENSSIPPRTKRVLLRPVIHSVGRMATPPSMKILSPLIPRPLRF